MVTIGIDLAAQPANTAACRVSWDERVAVDDPIVGIEDQAIADALTSADRVGIDVPLGWPVGFSQGLTQHAAGRGWPAEPAGKELT
jgi:predicted nuclease with RNAse H fold